MKRILALACLAFLAVAFVSIPALVFAQSESLQEYRIQQLTEQMKSVQGQLEDYRGLQVVARFIEWELGVLSVGASAALGVLWKLYLRRHGQLMDSVSRSRHDARSLYGFPLVWLLEKQGMGREAAALCETLRRQGTPEPEISA